MVNFYDKINQKNTLGKSRRGYAHKLLMTKSKLYDDWVKLHIYDDNDLKDMLIDCFEDVFGDKCEHTKISICVKKFFHKTHYKILYEIDVSRLYGPFSLTGRFVIDLTNRLAKEVASRYGSGTNKTIPLKDTSLIFLQLDKITNYVDKFDIPKHDNKLILWNTLSSIRKKYGPHDFAVTDDRCYLNWVAHLPYLVRLKIFNYLS